MIRLLRLLAIPVLLSACTPPPTMTTAKIVPPRVPDPSRPRLVAIVPLAGDTDGAFTAALEKALAGISIDGHPYFATVGRDKLTAALTARQSSDTPPSDADARAIGATTGAAGVLTGSVKVEFEERKPREQRTVCIRADEDGGCLRWGDAAVTCTRREVRVVFSPRLIVTDSGRISPAKSIRANTTAVSCSDSTKPETGRDELVRQAEELILKEFRKDIAPYFVTAEVPVMNSSEGIPSGEARDLFIQGLLAAEENRSDRACALWEKAGRFTSSSPGLTYNLGVCRELAGELEPALAAYQKAADLLKSPAETVTSAIDRLSREISSRARAAGEAVK